MLELRKIVQGDMELLFEWANESLARSMAINQDTIQWENHVKWFNEKLKNPNCFFYILENGSEPVGVIRFDKNEENKLLISYSIASQHRGKGYGLIIIEKGIQQLATSRIDENAVYVAYVKDSNAASSHIFLKLEFKKVREEVIHNQLFFVYEKD